VRADAGGELRVYDVNGRELMAKTIPEGGLEVQTAAWGPGTYLFILRNKSRIEQKIIAVKRP
jgi:hypothetical protein